MLLEHHPGLRVSKLSLGSEGAPLLVIDNLVADPERLARKAARSQFVAQASMFPGIRAPAPLSYQYFLETTLNPLLEECFSMQPGRFVFPMCHFSLVTLPPGKLEFLQRVPHIDSVSADGLASVHYLFHGDWGGTDFYRHRRSGFESIDLARRESYFQCLEQQRLDSGGQTDGYIGGDTSLFERIAQVQGVFNRMVVYRRNSLHSGSIDNSRVPPPDPMTGRLSINTFIDVLH
ncbi:hypothetical protein DT603_04655 [Pseudoxanthomonas gei]|uniref:Uncharacterized protein n=1 Tax=Pseudoxanthomonas gei TaxID=1383030 RepID=A0ABX0A9C3_9GAMM|nr:DUF6445 family protein [Pseudoxanthomonas gei]NDK38129.1 hypothetical protein [Pseudoxanthomonas gei]